MSTNSSDRAAWRMIADSTRAHLLDRMQLAADTNRRQRAAVDLLAATPVLDQPAIVRAAVDPAGGVDWDAIHHGVTSGALDLTQGQRQMVLIACSLASPFNARISLGACLVELDDRQAGAVLAAVRHVLEGGAR